MPVHLVCLTFDHDNASLMIAAWADLADADLARGFRYRRRLRILSLLAADGAPSTWFIPGHTIESYPSCVERLRAAT